MAELVKYAIFVILFGIGENLKVYDWQRDYGSDVTQEFAQVSDTDLFILHSAIDTGATNHVPAISFLDYNFVNRKLEKGITIVRPLLSNGNQLCFVAKQKTDWDTAVSTLQSRHKMTVTTDSIDDVYLRKRLPLNLDPLTVNTISEFCGVERDYIFYLVAENDMSVYNRSFYLQTAFQNFNIGVEDEDVPTVFGSG